MNDNDKLLTALYNSIFEPKHNASDNEKSEANKVVFFYNCGRFNPLQACYRLTLIFNHLIDLIYTDENNEIINKLEK